MPAKEFALYRAGVYDMAAIKELPWPEYRPFVLKLFAVREHPHQRYGFNLEGYLGTHSALIWNYPDHKSFTLDYAYVDDLHGCCVVSQRALLRHRAGGGDGFLRRTRLTGRNDVCLPQSAIVGPAPAHRA